MIEGLGQELAIRLRGWRLGLGAALIFLMALAVYWPALGGGFVWDDALLVNKNLLATGELSLGSVWFQTDFPLSLVALWVEWLAWGKNAGGYHAVNVLLHAASAVLVWRILARLRIPGAFLAALIFTVHPVCVGSVAWISEIKNTLSLPFYLLSIWWYLAEGGGEKVEGGGEKAEGGGQRAEGGGRSEEASPSTPAPRPSTFSLHPSYYLSLIAFVLALLSKTSTVMLPVVLLGLAWWQRGRVTRHDWLRCLPYFGLALAFGLMTVWFQYHQTIGGLTVQEQSFWGRLAGAAMAIWFYLGKILLPLNLSMIYTRWTINERAPLAYLPLLLLFLSFALCWRFRRSWGRAVLFGLGYFAITLFPALGFFDMYFLSMSRVSDHFQYLSLIGVVALAAAGLSLVFQPSVTGPSLAAPREGTRPTMSCRARALTRRAIYRLFLHPSARWNWVIGHILAVVLLAVLSILAWQRARVLANDEMLWRDTLAKNRTAWSAHNNLGCILAEQQQYDAAITHFEAALESNPLNAPAHFNLAKALVLQGRNAEAETHFRDALAITPSANIHVEFARLLYQTGKIQEAIRHYRQALSLKPDLTEALNNLAWLLASASDASVRNGPEAVRVAEHACRVTQYKEAIPVGTLAAAYAEAGRFTEAVATAEKATQLATSSGNEQFAAINRQLLTYYRAGKPWHQPPGKN